MMMVMSYFIRKDIKHVEIMSSYIYAVSLNVEVVVVSFVESTIWIRIILKIDFLFLTFFFSFTFVSFVYIYSIFYLKECKRFHHHQYNSPSYDEVGFLCIFIGHLLKWASVYTYICEYIKTIESEVDDVVWHCFLLRMNGTVIMGKEEWRHFGIFSVIFFSFFGPHRIRLDG